MSETDFHMERWRAAARMQAALKAMQNEDLSGAEAHLAYATQHLQEAQRIKDRLPVTS